MCGIAGILSLNENGIKHIGKKVAVMNHLLAHRGPDGSGIWADGMSKIGLGHTRLSIIDLATGAQPMSSDSGNALVFNGEIYNYKDIKKELSDYPFHTNSDTEVILAAYEAHGIEFIHQLRGMFSIALWDAKEQALICIRDRFGIKPFYYTVEGGVFHFASEIKALLPFVEKVETDPEALREYLSFQFCMGSKTLFKGIHQLEPGHYLTVRNGDVNIKKYWEVYYDLDYHHTDKYFEEKVMETLRESVNYHMVSDVPVGAYVSGGIDSSLIAALGAEHQPDGFMGFTGKFNEGAAFDESGYARVLAEDKGFPLIETTITAKDFSDTFEKLIFHLDQPVAGPGSFAQYMVSQTAGKHRKVVLGGQGGDEIFGGYARYMIAYFEQCIKAGLEGKLHNGNFVVTYESIIPNLPTLEQYKPMIRQFWSSGLFDSLENRYYALINRAPNLTDEIRWEALNHDPYEKYLSIFKADNVRKESYFDLMTHFDFKTLLPALLQVEDRVSMAHGLESRVPLLDHKLVELAATMPADVKFKNGELKRVLKKVARGILPDPILDRKDKMGFPVPLNNWMKGDLREYVSDVLTTSKAQGREYIDNQKALRLIEQEGTYGRNLWAILSLEMWQQQFHDKAHYYKNMINQLEE